MNTGIVKWALFIPVAGFAAWRIVTLNLADHYAQESDPASSQAALNWRTEQPKAMLQSGMATVRDDPLKALDILDRTVKANPTEGRALALMGLIYQTRKQDAKAESAMKLADWQSPQRTDVQSTLAQYWMQRGDVARALQHLDAVLRHGGDASKYYPTLLRLAEIPQYDAAYAALLKSPLNWWSGFFAYVAQNAVQADTLRMLYHLAANSPNKPDDAVMRHYMQRLQKEGAWMEAYFAWMNSLSKEQLSNLGNVFNGGFELPLSNVGFDWIVAKTPQALIETASTYGITGNRALHVAFNGQRIRFQHLAQYTVLAPGAYRFQGRVRPDGLKAERGLQWTVSCLGKPVPLATSERFTGTDQWHYFSTQFVVPETDCPAQQLRLELSGQSALDFEATGNIWFDDLVMERVE